MTGLFHDTLYREKTLKFQQVQNRNGLYAQYNLLVTCYEPRIQ